MDFLFLLSAYINGTTLPENFKCDIGRVFNLSMSHSVSPMIYSVLSKSAQKNDILPYKKICYRQFCSQVEKNIEFLNLYREFKVNNFDVIVLKGPICAYCYREPDMRLCSDFDLLINENEKNRMRKFLIDLGFKPEKENYASENGSLYLEIKTTLSEGSDKIKKISSEIFEGYEKRTITIGDYKTLGYNDNLLYIICHAFKHFVGSGFGIKQLMDIMLFSEKFKDKIDFDYCLSKLKILNADLFTFNVYNAAQIIFGRDLSYILDKKDGRPLYYDEFISDILDAGVYGASSEDRLHSAAIVNDAYENNGKKSLKSAVFPKAQIMKSRYPVLNRVPILLPIVYLYRILTYLLKVVFRGKTLSPKNSVKIADERIELMKKMGVIM